MKLMHLGIATVLAGCLLAGDLTAQQVVRAPDLPTLEERWQWAMEHGDDQDIWVGYSIDRLMRKTSWIGMFRSTPEPGDTTLYELLTGRTIEFNDMPDEEDLRSEAEIALQNAEGIPRERMVVKEVAFLYRFTGSERGMNTLSFLQTTNVGLEVDLEGLRLIWLGKADGEESLRHIETVYAQTEGAEARKRLVAVTGLHGRSERVLASLISIAENDASADVREQAVFWISQQDTKEALEYLVGVARTEAEEDIADKAVFGISRMSGDAPLEELIRLGRDQTLGEVRKKAIFWLGQKASRKAAESLKEIVYGKEDEDIQKKAVFALAHMERGGGVDEMVRIATTHPNPKVRKQAIFWLGQSDDPSAFEAIVKIVRGR